MKKAKKLLSLFMGIMVIVSCVFSTLSVSALTIEDSTNIDDGPVIYIMTNKNTTITLEKNEYGHTDSQITPTVTSVVFTKSGGAQVTLTSDDYTVSYGENIALGKGTVTVTGTQDTDASSSIYFGTATVEFDIVHEYVESVVPATYEEQGYTLHKCSTCGDEYKDNYTEKLKYPDLQGKIYYQTRTDDTNTVRFVMEVAESDIVEATEGTVTLENKDLGFKQTMAVTKAFRGIVAGDKTITAPEGKVFILSYAVHMDEVDTMDVALAVDNYELPLAATVTIK